MANYKTHAINLKFHNLGEADKIVTIYSRDYGIVRCAAKGVKKSTSKLGGRMQAFSANNLMLAKGRNLDIICQAESIESFGKIRDDLTRLAYAFYCVELVNHFGTENDPNSPKIYDALFETLKNISMFNEVEEILWAVMRFKLKLSEYSGYAVELETCVKCNCHEKEFKSHHFFCPDSGGVICGDCGASSHESLEIDRRYMKLFRDVTNFDFPFENEHRDKMLLFSSFNILKEFISRRTEKKLKTLELMEILC